MPGISLALPCLACILSGWVYGGDLRQPVCRRHKKINSQRHLASALRHGEVAGGAIHAGALALEFQPSGRLASFKRDPGPRRPHTIVWGPPLLESKFGTGVAEGLISPVFSLITCAARQHFWEPGHMPYILRQATRTSCMHLI
jgi:hypothetical protein